ncbi:uncharacterized protein BJ212DRAFT_1303586 [Suillus subaureus]|uniref:Uncharacterized protein n=1 Tax=Suillus subaureus TaxID=48587 RepID=A0A9P7E008_9AGAM|nr:uncharacterized protein BJ212DRAFT_1303586 [Suillus subaureus]KAG1807126.1 hypothetical protein BJ212DRAFT_1303586 [Suillus subaureus]
MEFHGLGLQEYEVIEEVLGEMGQVSKPSTVEVFIWVWGDDETTIDLDNEDTEHMAHGTLLLDINMDTIKSMLKWGLEKIRDSLVEFSKRFDPNTDCTKLKEAIIMLPIRWKDFVIALNNGADVTAWKRYKAWHEKIIKARVLSGLSSSHGCSKHKCTSASLPPPLKCAFNSNK